MTVVTITKTGVKLLDFGLAKAFQPLAAGGDAVETVSLPAELTERGMFVAEGAPTESPVPT